MKISSIINSNKEIFVSVKLTNDKILKELNKKYFKIDDTTDVLSFNMDEEMDDHKYYLGDIAVNVDQAQRQAKTYGNSLEEEIAALVEHGVLHLLGVHHPDDDTHSVHGIKLDEIK